MVPPTPTKCQHGCASKYCLHLLQELTIVLLVNSKHKKTLKAILAKPTLASIAFSEIESLVLALGGEVHEGEGSRVGLHLNGGVMHAHRPHPGKEAKRYQIKEIGEWLKASGVKQS